MSKLAIFSDVHANLEALDSVLSDMKAQGITERYCLGDVIGYGASPNEVVERIRKEKILCLRGNHDEGACMLKVTGRSKGEFNGKAAVALAWTSREITPATVRYLSTCEYTHTIDSHPFSILLTHASPQDPVKWNYVVDDSSITQAFNALQPGMINFHGHTHQPFIAAQDYSNRIRLLYGKVILSQTKYQKVIVNVGSVGQPRDGDNRACYAIYNMKLGCITFRRVPYDIEKAQEKIRQHSYDDTGCLAERLALGK